MRIPEDARAARYVLERHRDYIRHLELARSAAMHIGLECDELNTLLTQSSVIENQLSQRTGEVVQSRRKHKKKVRREGEAIPRFYLFLDECGSHSARVMETTFPVFALCGVVIREENLHELDVKWKNWKIATTGIDDDRIHEPDVRKFRRRFHRTTQFQKDEIDESLHRLLNELDFHCISAVVDLRELSEQYPTGRIDDFLPQSCYLMAIDFIMERFVHYLREAGDSGRGSVIAESRDVKEDVSVNYEYVRLQKEGTQFVSESDFRWYLSPYMRFLRKSANSTGLQIADIAARPLAEKILDPSSEPKRWDIISNKLYDGLKGKPESYGLKVFPPVEGNDLFRQ